MSERIKQTDNRSPQTAEDADMELGERYVRDELTGFVVVKARPGDRRVTSEEILAQLEDFP